MFPLQAQYQFIDEVLEYKPAPGQFINKEPWGVPSSAASIEGTITGALCLGAYGGYVVFRFEEPVVNHSDHPFGVDFIIFGNATSSFSEPASVWVMKDENKNGQPDGTWYQLAGSDYFFSSTHHQYEVTYFNPGTDYASDVPWVDNLGGTGFVYTNDAHTQPYYPLHALFPDIYPDEYTLRGTRIEGFLDDSNPGFINSYPRAFGYADNQVRGTEPYNVPDNPYTSDVENAGGDGFDISWAVNPQGEYVDLDTIHFVKVQTAMVGDAGWLGEISSEITGAVKVEPDPLLSGVTDLIVIKDLPHEITTSPYQLEALAFQNGRVQWDAELQWDASLDGAHVDEDMLLHLTGSGELTLTVSRADNPNVSACVTVNVNLQDDPVYADAVAEKEPLLYPNPAGSYIRIQTPGVAQIEIFNAKGEKALEQLHYTYDQHISLEGLPAGLYLVRIHQKGVVSHIKLLKN